MELDVKLEGVQDIAKKLFLDSRQMTVINKSIGIAVREHVADHLAQASVTRHKCADRLGAPHSKFLEFAPARGQIKGGSSYRPEDGEQPHYTEVTEVTPKGATVVIANTPGLRRAFEPLHIRPKKAKALTIPISREAYDKRARKFGRELFCITSRKGQGLLVEKTDDAKHRLRPHYLLVKSATIPKDEGLLPTEAKMKSVAGEALEAALELMLG